MSEETAKALADAMNRLAAAIESLKAGGGCGIQVFHHGIPANVPQVSWGWPCHWPPMPGGYGGGSGQGGDAQR